MFESSDSFYQQLWSERKEPKEVLECYNSTKLVLSGNSSHLAPWHAKLGIQKGVPIATLNSLNPDGGLVAFMDIVVLKVRMLWPTPQKFTRIWS